jgi:hypothetical protein
VRSSSKAAPDRVGRTIVYGVGFVNSGRQVRGALKVLEKAEIIRRYRSMPARLAAASAAFNKKSQICALPEICC